MRLISIADAGQDKLRRLKKKDTEGDQAGSFGLMLIHSVSLQLWWLRNIQNNCKMSLQYEQNMIPSPNHLGYHCTIQQTVMRKFNFAVYDFFPVHHHYLATPCHCLPFLLLLHHPPEYLTAELRNDKSLHKFQSQLKNPFSLKFHIHHRRMGTAVNGRNCMWWLICTSELE